MDVAPGWICDKAHRKYHPVQQGHEVKTEQCPPTYSFRFWKKTEIQCCLETTTIFKEKIWVKDYHSIKNRDGDVILLEGSKTIEQKGCDVSAHHQDHVVSSVNFKAFVDMLIHSSQHIEDELLPSFEKYLHSVVNGDSECFIPSKCSAFTETYIYPKGKEGQLVTPVKQGFQEFCRLLTESEVRRHPFSTYLLAPTSQEKTTKSSSTNVYDTSRKQELVHSSYTTISSTSCKIDVENTIEIGINTKNQHDVIIANNNSIRGGSRDIVDHGTGTQTEKSASLKNVSNSSLYVNLPEHDYCGSNSRLRNDGQLTSAQRSQDFRKGSESRRDLQPVGVHKSKFGSGVPQQSVKETQIFDNVSHLVKQTNFSKHFGPHEKDEEVNGVLGSDCGLRSEVVVTMRMPGVQEEYENNTSYTSYDCSSGTVAPDDCFVLSVNQTISNSNQLHENRGLTLFSGNPSSGKSEQDRIFIQSGHRVRYERQSSAGDPETSASDGGSPANYITENEPIHRNSVAKDHYESEAQAGKGSRNLYPNLKEEFPSDDIKHSEHETPLGESTRHRYPSMKDVVPHDTNQRIYSDKNSRGEDDRPIGFRNDKNDVEGESSGFLRIKPRLFSEETQNSEVDGSLTQDSDDTHGQETMSQGYNKESATEDEENISLLPGYLKPMEEAYEQCGMMRKYYGVHSEKKQKTILLLGAVGSGKTTLVNFVANYFSGVKSPDEELTHVVRHSNDVRSRTKSITAYTFCYSKDDCPVTVIDTPGLNDSSGAEVRDHVQSLKTFLANVASQNYEIHAIGFVAQAHLVRLTSSERLVMDYVSTLFGEDVVEHFITFVTFADNQETPPVVEAMKSYGTRSKMFLKFNNSSLSSDKNEDIDELDRVYWRIGSKSWKKCVKYLQNLPALSINTMKAVENEMYATTVIDSAERDLRAELKAYIGCCRNIKQRVDEVNRRGGQVWELAGVLKCLKSTELSCSVDTKTVLTQFAEEVCKENNFASPNCIRFLSLVSSGKLFQAAIEVLQSMAPLYRYVDENLTRYGRGNSKHSLEVLFCCVCKEDHELQRSISTKKSPITYKCTQCSCDRHKHKNSSHDTEPSQSFTLSRNKLLRHTNNCLKEITSDFSIPEYPITVEYYLQHINQYYTSYDFGTFMKDLQKMPS